jgi:signal transduction histidine kinase/ligand-binding sensor domain-containing protein
MSINKKAIYFITAIVFFLFWVEDLHSYLVRNYSDRSGLAMNVGVSIVQDKMGYIWISSQIALHRFDGKDMKTFTKNQGLPDNFINKLYIDDAQNLWIGTQKGLARYNYSNGCFDVYDRYISPGNSEDHKHVICMAESPVYSLLVGTDSGLWTLNLKNPGNGYLSKIDLKEKNKSIECRINTIAVDVKKGIIYLGTPDQGLIIFQNNKAARIIKYNELIINNIDALLTDDQGLWIGTEDKLLFYEDTVFTEKTTAGNPPQSIKGIKAIFKTKNEQPEKLWIGTAEGLFFQVGNKIYRHPASDIFDSNYVQCIEQDHEGGLWLGTYSGVSYLLPHSKFQTYSKQNGLLQNTVFGIHEDKNKRIWIATYGGLTVIVDQNPYDLKIQSFSTREYLPSNIIRSITSDSQTGDIWIGAYVGGLTRLKIQPGPNQSINIKPITYPANRYNFPHNDVRVVYTDSGNRLWLGMRYGGIILFDKATERIIEHWEKGQEELFNDNVWFISEDSKGNIWAGVDNGLCKLSYNEIKKKYTITNYNKDYGLDSNDTQGICEDGAIYWVATFGYGLYQLDETKPKAHMFQHLTEKDNIQDNYIFGVLKDKKNPNHLWLTTNKGVYVWDKIEKKVVAHYDMNDGLPSNENNSLSGYRDSRDRIWFSTPGGAACMDTHNIPVNEEKPTVYIEEIVVKDRNDNEITTHPVLFDKNPLILGHDENNLYIKFTALCYQNPDAVKFDYILEGYQVRWIHQTNKRFVEFPNLPHGNYTFKVRVYNNDGVSSETDAQYNFVIKPAFYETWIFRIIIALLFFLMIYGFFRYRLAHKEQQKKELERIVKERSEKIKNIQGQLIQQEKMAALGTLVAGIAHELNNPVALIKMNAEFFAKAWEEIASILDEYAKNKTGLEITGLPYQESKREMDKLITGLLKGSKRISRIIDELRTFSEKDYPSNKEIININKVIEAAINLTRNLLKNATNRFSFKLKDDLPDVYGNFQRLEQVLINLIQNACQALSEKSQGIFISTNYDEQTQRVVIKVKDEGVGIDTQTVKYITDPFFTTKRDSGCIGLGLAISYQVVQEHGGNIDFESVPGQGTTVSVYLPVKPLKAAAKQAVMEVK